MTRRKKSEFEHSKSEITSPAARALRCNSSLRCASLRDFRCDRYRGFGDQTSSHPELVSGPHQKDRWDGIARYLASEVPKQVRHDAKKKSEIEHSKSEITSPAARALRCNFSFRPDSYRDCIPCLTAGRRDLRCDRCRRGWGMNIYYVKAPTSDL